MSKLDAIKKLNEKVFELHNAHYKNSPTGLIDKNDAPNSNTIYHLYNDGEITYQKGSWAYLQRTEFSDVYPLYNNVKEAPFEFPIVMNRNESVSYAVLTRAECVEMRKKMDEIRRMSEEEP